MGTNKFHPRNAGGCGDLLHGAFRYAENPCKQARSSAFACGRRGIEGSHSRSANRSPEGLVFATRHGGPLASNNLRKRGLQSACKRAGLPRINWHVLRHTHGTLLHVQGTPLKVAQAQLGHSHMATTLEVYTHATVIAQREAVGLLDEQLTPSVPKKEEGNSRAAEMASPTNCFSQVSGAPGEIRTPDPLLRRQTLYPTELRARRADLLILKHFSTPQLPISSILRQKCAKTVPKHH